MLVNLIISLDAMFHFPITDSSIILQPTKVEPFDGSTKTSLAQSLEEAFQNHKIVTFSS